MSDQDTIPYITPHGYQPEVDHTKPVTPPMPDMQAGQKFDTGKLRWDLLMWPEVESIVEVLTYGAAKYAPENWRKVEQWQDRYFAAAMRHLVAYRGGEQTDPESGKPHLAHAACSLLFLMAKENEEAGNAG